MSEKRNTWWLSLGTPMAQLLLEPTWSTCPKSSLCLIHVVWPVFNTLLMKSICLGFIVYVYSVKSNDRKILGPGLWLHYKVPEHEFPDFLASLWSISESLSPPPLWQSLKSFHKEYNILNFSLTMCSTVHNCPPCLKPNPLLHIYENTILTQLSTVDSIKCTWWKLGSFFVLFLFFDVTVISLKGIQKLLKVRRWGR